MTLTKRCSKCGEMKAVELFRPGRKQCKPCAAQATRASYKVWAEANKEALAAYKRTWAANKRDRQRAGKEAIANLQTADATSLTCGRCKEGKPPELFHRDAKRSSGRCLWCKECVREYQSRNKEALRAQQREYRRRQAEAIDAKRREYRASPGVRVRRAERQKDYVARNNEVARAKAKLFRQENRERLNAKSREYATRNKLVLKIKKQEWFSCIPDCYVTTLLADQLGLPTNEIPPELVPVKREMLKQKRAHRAITKHAKEQS